MPTWLKVLLIFAGIAGLLCVVSDEFCQSYSAPGGCRGYCEQQGLVGSQDAEFQCGQACGQLSMPVRQYCRR
jgi:hypothetical protein